MLKKRVTLGYTISQESFDSIASYWTDWGHRLKWDSVFVLPACLKVWGQEFGSGLNYTCPVTTCKTWHSNLVVLLKVLAAPIPPIPLHPCLYIICDDIVANWQPVDICPQMV